MNRLTDKRKYKDGRRLKGNYWEATAPEGAKVVYAAIDRLAQYEDAEEQGLLVRLPCKVGDTVKSVRYGVGEVVAWDTTARVKFAVDVKPNWPYMDYDINSKIFTRAEAEAALERKEAQHE